MKKTYKLEVELALDDQDEARVIELARENFRKSASPAVIVWSDGSPGRELSTEESVANTADALIELVGANAILEEAGVEVTSVSFQGLCGETVPVE